MTRAAVEAPETAAPAAMAGAVEVGVEEIPLPPDFVVEAMLAEDEAQAAASGSPAKADKAPAPTRDVAALAFTGVKARQTVVALDYPFALDGAVVESVTVRRLTTYEVGGLASALPADFDNFDVYAVMTGLPACVLRGLDDADGERVSTLAYDFLPRVFRPAAS